MSNNLTAFNTQIHFSDKHCIHGVVFDKHKYNTMSTVEFRNAFPKAIGECPNGCGKFGIFYVNQLHYFLVDG